MKQLGRVDVAGHLSASGADLRLGVSEKGSRRVQYISPAAIVGLKTSPENIQILNVWLYWHDCKLLPD